MNRGCLPSRGALRLSPEEAPLDLGEVFQVCDCQAALRLLRQSPEEVSLHFGEVFQVPPGEEEHVRLVFDLARKSTAGFESYARQVGRLFATDRPVLENLLGGLFHIALADGRIFPAEDAYLREVARHFGFDAVDYARIRALHVGAESEASEDPYAILGILPDASAGAIREAYHRLVREGHPDLVIAQGLPPECIALATARIARINAAYDQIAKGGAEPI